MKLRSFTPIRVDEVELKRRQARYSRLLPSGWDLVLENLPEGDETPHALDSDEQVAASQQAGLIAGSGTDPLVFDAILPDCVLDTGVRQLDETAGVPVLGLTRLSTHFLAACGLRFGVITRNETIGQEYRKLVEYYGLAASFDDVYVLGLSVEAIADEQIWNDAVEAAARNAIERGTTILINGCSAVEVTAAGGSVRIIDPTALALQVASLAASLDLLTMKAD